MELATKIAVRRRSSCSHLAIHIWWHTDTTGLWWKPQQKPGAADLHHSTSVCHCPITHAKYNNIALTREESWPSTLVHKEKRSCTLPMHTIHVLALKDVQTLAKISQQAALHSKCMLQWNLWITDTLGTGFLSFVERLSLSQRLALSKLAPRPRYVWLASSSGFPAWVPGVPAPIACSPNCAIRIARVAPLCWNGKTQHGIGEICV